MIVDGLLGDGAGQLGLATVADKDGQVEGGCLQSGEDGRADGAAGLD